MAFMPVASAAVCICHDSRTGIKTEFHSALVNIVTERLHSGGEAFGVGLEIAVFVALLQKPRIVHLNDIVSCVAEAFFNHRVGCFAYHLFIDIGIAEIVPCVPPHGRLLCKNHFVSPSVLSFLDSSAAFSFSSGLGSEETSIS